MYDAYIYALWSLFVGMQILIKYNMTLCFLINLIKVIFQ